MADSYDTRQGDLFNANTLWFHTFQNLIVSGDAAALSHAAFKILIVMRAYVNFKNGGAIPPQTLLAKKSGCSLSTVKRCLVELERNQHIEKQKRGRKNVYVLKEKFQIKNMEGQHVATAHCDYVPSLVEAMRSELKRILKEQVISNATIQIKSLNIQIVNQAGVAIQFNSEMAGVDAGKNTAHP
jgi:DNA-binding transcriptional regulator YhcF (GntR family)